jgi:hypothetical protein
VSSLKHNIHFIAIDKAQAGGGACNVNLLLRAEEQATPTATGP